MSTEGVYEELVDSLTKANNRLAGAIKATEPEELTGSLIRVMAGTVADAAEQAGGLFRTLTTAVERSPRQSRVDDGVESVTLRPHLGLEKVYSGPLNRETGEIGTADEDDDDLTPPERLRRETVAAEGRSRNGR